MKILLAVLVLASPLAHAQTLFNLKLPAFALVGGTYNSITNVPVPTNTTARILSFLTTANVTGGTLTVTFAGSPAFPIDIATQEFLNIPILGPCTVGVSINAASAAAAGIILVELQPVNTAVNPGGTMIQPTGFTTSLALQTSTNLTTWSTLTNTIWGKTNTARFFRMSQTIP